ncbi:MAG: O-antigen ligase family protein [Kiritimatiellae bacterium]|nr:O-antigen ligase family protein [Kiritimatiellia bacterium]
MKYFVFTVAALGVPPLAYLFFINSRWMRHALWGMAAAMFAWQGTAINFLSHEDYRGSARGMEVSLVYLLAFALLGVAALKHKVKSLLPDGGFRIYAVYFLLCLPSLSTAASGELAWCELWKMLMIYSFSLSILCFLRMSGDVKSVLLMFALIIVGNFFIVSKMHFSGVYQPRGIFPHRNSMSMAMNLFGPVFFAAYLTHGARTWIGKLSALTCVCAGIASVWSYSRGAIAAMPIGYGIAAAACFLEGKRIVQKMFRILPVVVVLGVCLVALIPRIVERFQTASEASANTRVELAGCAWEMIKDEPLRGIGINNWGIKINRPYEYAERAGRYFPENMGSDGVVETVYLLVCAECGIPALAAMLAWFMWYWLLGVRLLRRLRGTKWYFIPAGAIGGLAANYLQGILEWVLRQQMNLIFLTGLFALLSYLGLEWRSLVAAERSDKT